MLFEICKAPKSGGSQKTLDQHKLETTNDRNEPTKAYPDASGFFSFLSVLNRFWVGGTKPAKGLFSRHCQGRHHQAQIRDVGLEPSAYSSSTFDYPFILLFSVVVFLFLEIPPIFHAIRAQTWPRIPNPRRMASMSPFRSHLTSNKQGAMAMPHNTISLTVRTCIQTQCDVC